MKQALRLGGGYDTPSPEDTQPPSPPTPTPPPTTPKAIAFGNQKACICGCRCALPSYKSLAAVSVNADGRIDGVLGFVGTDGCAQALINNRGAGTTAIVHPAKAVEYRLNDYAQVVVDRSRGFVQSDREYRYRIA